MRIVATEVVKKHWNLEADKALQVTLAVGGADKPACDVVVVTDVKTFRFTLNELMAADVAPSGIIIFLLLAGTQAFYRSIRPENRHNICLSHN